MLIIRGGRVIDPANRIDKKMNVAIDRGKIVEVLDPEADLRRFGEAEVFDAEGLVVCPGLVDLHVHLRDPGQEYKEDIVSGTDAAVAGGVTSVVCMGNTVPVNDEPSVTEYIIQKAKRLGACNVFPVSTISRGMEGRQLAPIAEQKNAGCVCITDDGRTVADPGLLRRAMEYAAGLDVLVAEHCEEPSLSHGHMHEGRWSVVRGISGKPAASEDIIVARDIELAKLTGCRLHIQHISSARAVDLVLEAKARGLPVTAEVTPHHLLLTDEDVAYNTNLKMNPPLRSAADRERLRAAVAEGVIDAIATDHAPHAEHEKECEFDTALPGLVGLETLLPLTLQLVRDKVLTLRRAVEALTAAPARVMNLPAGTLTPGNDADVLVFDPAARYTIDPGTFHSKSRNTPFGGREVYGKVVRTYWRGKLMYKATA